MIERFPAPRTPTPAPEHAELPLISGAMRRGELSYSMARALTRVATPDKEEALLGFAKAGTAAHVERLVRYWRRVDRLEGAFLDQKRRASRGLALHADEDGMVVVRGRLEPEAGAALRRALDAAQEALYQQEPESPAEQAEESTAEQRRADALGLVAESALTGGLDPGTENLARAGHSGSARQGVAAHPPRRHDHVTDQDAPADGKRREAPPPASHPSSVVPRGLPDCRIKELSDDR